MHFNLADLNINFQNDTPVNPVVDAVYKQFILPRFASLHNSVNCNIKVENFKITDELQKVETFTSNWWHLYKSKNNHEYFFVADFCSPKYPSWVLNFNKDFKNINVFYSEDNLIIDNHGKKRLKEIFRKPMDNLFFIHYLLKNKGILLHSAAAIINGKGCLFAGSSGAGKSSITRLGIKCGIGDWLTDERVAVRQFGDEFSIYGTPWPSLANVSQNKRSKLDVIFFIGHGKEPNIKLLSSKQASAKLIQISSIPWYDHELTEFAFCSINDFVKAVPMFEFSYPLEKNVLGGLSKFINTSI